jgi:hypothetical protein
MKYHITPKQAKELTKDQYYSMFNDLVLRDDWANYHHRKMTIGKMIDYLDGVSVFKGLGDGQWYVQCDGLEFEGKELTDALWEAVKDCM